MDLEAVMNWSFPVAEQRYDDRDAMLYALGVGLGGDPRDLDYLYEGRGPAVLPTFALTLGHPGVWFSDARTGIDWVRVLHGEQTMTIHRPLLPADAVVAATRVDAVVDKGEGKGALVHWSRTLTRAATGEPVAELASTLFCRGDGGCGSAGVPPGEALRGLPESAPDVTYDLPTSPRAALIYRLSGDRNPVHADPDVARAGGFDRPILHGLCTLAVAGYSAGRACLGDPGRLSGISARFSSPVQPGETIRTELWADGARWRFRARSVERDVVVLDRGTISARESS